MIETQRSVMGQGSRMSTQTPPESDPATRSGGAYLPKLPAGWRYAVTIKKPGEGEVEIREADGAHRVIVNGGAGPDDGAAFTVPTLLEALRVAAKTVKTLDRVAEHKAAAHKAEQELLADLHTLDNTDDDPTDPASDEKVPV